MPQIGTVNANAAAYAAQMSAQPDKLGDTPPMADDLRRVANGECCAMLHPHEGAGVIQLLVATGSPGIQQLALSIKIGPGTSGAKDPEKEIDEVKEGQETGNIKDSEEAIQAAKADIKTPIRERYHDGKRESKVPESFTKLCDAGKRTVVADAVEWTLSDAGANTPQWFAAILRLAAAEGFRGYLKNTVSQATYDKLDASAEPEFVRSVIDALDMRIK